MVLSKALFLPRNSVGRSVKSLSRAATDSPPQWWTRQSTLIGTRHVPPEIMGDLSRRGAWPVAMRLLTTARRLTRAAPSNHPASPVSPVACRLSTGATEEEDSHCHELKRLARRTRKLLQSSDRKNGPVNDQVLKEWNWALRSNNNQNNNKQQQPLDPTALFEAVDTLDEWVRHLIATSPVDRTLATTVGLVAWAQVAASTTTASSSDQAPLRAQVLFSLYEASRATTGQTAASFRSKEVAKAWRKERRNLYHSLLSVWSRSTRSDAADRAMQVLERMRTEDCHHATSPWPLVNGETYHRVMNVFAAQGRPEQVWTLIQEAKKWQEDNTATALAYDALIRAYQVRNEGSDIEEALKRWQHFLRIYSVTAKTTRPRVDQRPLALTLGRVMSLVQDNPVRVRELLRQAMSFCERFPECREMVDSRAFVMAIQAEASAGNLEKAKELVDDMVAAYETGNDLLKPTPQVFGVVLRGYANAGTAESLAQAEKLLHAMEEQFLGRMSDNEETMDQTSSNILLAGYERSGLDNAVPKIQKLIGHMQKLAKRLDREELLPDRVSYTILMMAFVKRGGPECHKNVEAVLKVMQADKRPNTSPDNTTYAVVLDALAKTMDPLTVTRAERIFESLEQPDTACFNILMNLYAKLNRPYDAETLLQRMQSDYETGRNTECCPTPISYSTVLKAWQQSKDPHRWEKVVSLYEQILHRHEKGDPKARPNSYTVSALLHTLAEAKEASVAKHVLAIDLVDRLGDASIWKNPRVGCAFIILCGEALGDRGVRREALQYAFDRFRLIGTAADHRVYAAMLDTCSKLIDHPDERNESFKELFYQCVDEGHVSRLVLYTAWRLCPPDLYLNLTLQDAKDAPSMASIPHEWTRNAPRI